MICIRVADFDYFNGKTYNKDYTVRNISPEKQNSILKKDCLLIEKSGGGEKQSVGRVVQFKEDFTAVCSNFVCQLLLNENNDPGYYNYLFNTLYSYGINKKSIKQNTGIQNLDLYSYFSERVPVPSYDEQINIASFFNHESIRIKKIIIKYEKLLELLKEKRLSLINTSVTVGLNPDVEMKDSGVEWIDKIPKHWEIDKIKYNSRVLISNIDKKSKDNESEVLLCNYIDVYNNEFIKPSLSFMEATASNEQINKLGLDIGDVIITKDSETAEDIAVPSLVNEQLENVVCGYHLAVIRPNFDKIIGEFLFRSLQSKKINSQFVMSANGVTRFGISTYPIKNSYILIPPITEQKLICENLDKSLSLIDKLVDKISLQMNLLREYKISLIFNAVSGKIDVVG